uniref:Pilus assembly protein PilW n=1 Tax=Macrostomum lignano TaxID=282301 RepID=A0A1I8F262_9PLAT
TSGGGPVAVNTDNYQSLQLVWTQQSLNISIGGVRLADLSVPSPANALEIRTVGYTTLGDGSYAKQSQVMFDMPSCSTYSYMYKQYIQ